VGAILGAQRLSLSSRSCLFLLFLLWICKLTSVLLNYLVLIQRIEDEIRKILVYVVALFLVLGL
jgi:hypothetical protein